MLKLLMIEDDKELAQLLQKRLLKDAVEVTIALAPLEGLELFRNQKFDLLILDLSLPQMDGLTICRLIRQGSTIPIIISSARSSIEDKNTPFHVDEGAHEIMKNSLPLRITPAEYEILSYMIQKARTVISREELLMNIGSIKYESSLKSIDVIMGRIRQKIGDDTKNPRYILTVRGIGYKFVNQ